MANYWFIQKHEKYFLMVFLTIILTISNFYEVLLFLISVIAPSLKTHQGCQSLPTVHINFQESNQGLTEVIRNC